MTIAFTCALQIVWKHPLRGCLSRTPWYTPEANSGVTRLCFRESGTDQSEYVTESSSLRSDSIWFDWTDEQMIISGR